MRLKKIMLIFSFLCLGLFLTGCDKITNSKSKVESNKGKSDADDVNSEERKKKKSLDSLTTKGQLKSKDQFAKPEKGEEYAVIKVKNFGIIKCKLFPEVAPNSIKNFKDFAKAGRYDGGTFHRVIKDFMIQTGVEADEKGEIKKSGVELNPFVHHVNGALCMARSRSKGDGQGCQIYLVSNGRRGQKFDFDRIKKQTDEAYKREGLNISVDFDENTRKMYEERGGTPELDMLYTVIGQVFEGQDVVDKIASVPTKSPKGQENGMGEKSVPETPVVIEKIEILKA